MSIDNIINLYQLIVVVLSRSTALESKDSKVEHAGAQLYLDVGGKGFEVTLLSLPVPQTENPPRPKKGVKVKITSTTSKRQGKQAAKRQVSDFKRSYCECDCIIYTTVRWAPG